VQQLRSSWCGREHRGTAISVGERASKRPKGDNSSSNSNGKEVQSSLAQMLKKMKSEHEGGEGSGKQ
jgi:hypothetical protein